MVKNMSLQYCSPNTGDTIINCIGVISPIIKIQIFHSYINFSCFIISGVLKFMSDKKVKEFKVSNPSTYYSLNDIKRVIAIDTYTNYYLLIYSISKLSEDERKDLYYHIFDVINSLIQNGETNITIKTLTAIKNSIIYDIFKDIDIINVDFSLPNASFSVDGFIVDWSDGEIAPNALLPSITKLTKIYYNYRDNANYVDIITNQFKRLISGMSKQDCMVFYATKINKFKDKPFLNILTGVGV